MVSIYNKSKEEQAQDDCWPVKKVNQNINCQKHTNEDGFDHGS